MTSLPDDPLAGEVSIEASLDQNGIKAKAKSRIISALDRLVGSAIDIPGASIEGISRRIRLRNEVNENLIAIEGRAAAERLRLNESLGERVSAKFLGDVKATYENREAVAIEAVESLRALPPPDQASSNDHSDVGPDQIDEDWLNVFADFSGKASSDRLRSLWGRILAGEVREPGTFSLTTLRFVAELDKEIAELFARLATNRTADGFVVKPKILKNQDLLDYSFLEEVGLFQDGLSFPVEPQSEGKYIRASGDYLLIVRLNEGKSLRVPVYKLTRVGREIASILPFDGGVAALTEAGRSLDVTKSERIEIARILTRSAEGLRYSTLEVIHG